MKVGVRSAWLVAGAVLATAGVAHAQEGVSTERAAGTPWYERFTTSTGVAESITGGENDRLPQATWDLNQRWGVTVDIREGERVNPRLDLRPEDQTAVGAYYQFTPRVRLGGEVSVGAAQRAPVAPAGRRAEDEAAAGVRIESAFRF